LILGNKNNKNINKIYKEKKIFDELDYSKPIYKKANNIRKKIYQIFEGNKIKAWNYLNNITPYKIYKKLEKKIN